ncbi:ferritin family protein, partial [Cysteiniphilum litorale]|uniref:ferritin family protein n=1 Tax=Cysteiniphilum litorale TaxID=2056700 RepID=UPI003F88426A
WTYGFVKRLTHRSRTIYFIKLILLFKAEQPTTTMASCIRQNYHENSEASINKQINMELYASYVYMSLSAYYQREDVALPGLAKFFGKCSDEEREHGQKFIKYQLQRGGRLLLQAVAAPALQEWGSALDGLQAALDLEKQVNQSLLDLHVVASNHGDPHLTNFLEGDFLEEQVEAMKELADMITRLNRAGPTGTGEYIFDRDLL